MAEADTDRAALAIITLVKPRGKATAGRRMLAGSAPFLAVVALVLAIRAGVMLGEYNSLPAQVRTTLANDAARYHDIATAPGRPYRDFQVEVPPVALGLIEAIDGSNGRDTALRLGWSQLVLDVLLTVALAIGWGRITALAYLVLSMPLAFFLYFRIDLLSVFLTVAALALVKRGRDRAGGVALAIAVLAKIWPLAIAPALLVERRRRALVWFGASLAVGVAAWIAWGGTDGPRQVLTFRGAHGWQIESVIGAVLWVTSSARSTLQSGAVRMGRAPAWARALLLAALVALVALAWRLSARRRTVGSEFRLDAMAALTAVAAVLVCSPLLSSQFVSWLVPFAAIAWAEGAQVALPALVAGITTLTAVGVFTSKALVEHSWAGQAPLLSRNVLLLVLLMLGLLSLARLRSST